jgi:hypothetical protein
LAHTVEIGGNAGERIPIPDGELIESTKVKNEAPIVLAVAGRRLFDQKKARVVVTAGAGEIASLHLFIDNPAKSLFLRGTQSGGARLGWAGGTAVDLRCVDMTLDALGIPRLASEYHKAAGKHVADQSTLLVGELRPKVDGGHDFLNAELGLERFDRGVNLKMGEWCHEGHDDLNELGIDELYVDITISVDFAKSMRHNHADVFAAVDQRRHEEGRADGSLGWNTNPDLSDTAWLDLDGLRSVGDRRGSGSDDTDTKVTVTSDAEAGRGSLASWREELDHTSAVVVACTHFDIEAVAQYEPIG